ncbi:hypothetical protein GEMRC1_007687 [Eukaryota sp. GEM-RC1]
MVSLVFIFVVLIFIGCSAEPYAGVQSTISNRGVKHITDVVVAELRKQLTNVQLPNQSGKAHSPIGSIKYDLTAIFLTNPNFGGISIRNDAGGIRLDISSVSCHIHMNWHYKYNFIKDSGSADIDVAANIGISADIVPSPTGGVTATLRNPVVGIGQLKIKLHGGASWLYNLFVDVFSHDIKKSAQSAMLNAMTTTLQALIKESLSGVDPIVPIDEFADLDFRLKKLFSPQVVTFPAISTVIFSKRDL